VSKVEIDLVDLPILDNLSIDFNLFLTLDSIAPVPANASKVEVLLNIPSNLRRKGPRKGKKRPDAWKKVR
jgi:hypothetical protein